MADQSSKTEKPSPQRLEKARREGRFATSREFVGAFQFMAFAWVLYSWTGEWFDRARQVIRILLEQAFHPGFGSPELIAAASLLIQRLLWPILIGGLAVASVSVAAHLAVTRFGFSFQRLTFDPQKINPIKRIREIPKQGFPAVVQASVMLVIFGFVLYGIARDKVALFFFLPLARPETGVRQVAEALMSLMWKAAGLFVVFGAVDLFRQVRRYQREMRMSKEELREEYKQSEGNPQIKMRVRRIQRDARRKRMMSEVATATAVIVNPTHYAVALRYKHDEMSTPVVVAKGKNFLALRIRQKAIEHQVPLVENPPLAQALYKSVDVGQEIRPELYRAVAEILAYIYQLMDKRTATGRPGS
jgi:flagellar biosynthetic protein FlhB